MKVTISGKEYKLGNIPPTQENLDRLYTFLDNEISGAGVKAFRELMHVSISYGESEEAAGTAMRQLPLMGMMDENSELFKAKKALIYYVMGKAEPTEG